MDNSEKIKQAAIWAAKEYENGCFRYSFYNNRPFFGFNLKGK